MKVVFLDIDGVLNNHPFLKKTQEPRTLDPQNIEELNDLIEATGARIVISSSWRFMFDPDKLRQILIDSGVRNLIVLGETTKFSSLGPERGHEIQQWLDNHAGRLGITSFVILDDDADMADLSGHLVQTSMETGLTSDHVIQAIKILNQKVNL